MAVGPGWWLRLVALAVALAAAAQAGEAQGGEARAGEAPLAWETLPSMPSGVFNAAISLVPAGAGAGQAVITGGIDGTGQASTLVQVFDLDTHAWRIAARLPVGRCFHAQVTLPDGRIFIAGGQSGQVPRRLVARADGALIDPASGDVQPIPELPRPVEEPTAHLLPDGRVVFVGGRSASIFDPARAAWVDHIDLRETRRAHASVLLDGGRVLVVGGINRRSLELVDPHTRTSRLLAARLDEGLDDLAALALPDGRVLVLGGQKIDGDTVDHTWMVDLSGPASTLAPGPRLGVARGIADHVAGLIGEWAVIAGGESERGGVDWELDLARLVDTRTMEVWSLPPMSVPHDDAVALAVGRAFYIFGGFRAENTPLPGLKLPTSVAAVERLVLPE